MPRNTDYYDDMKELVTGEFLREFTDENAIPRRDMRQRDPIFVELADTLRGRGHVINNANALAARYNNNVSSFL